MKEDARIETALDALRGLDPNERKFVFKQIRAEREVVAEQAKAEAQMLPNSHWSKAHLLERIRDPSNEGYEQRIHIPEFTFLGVGNQPDFGEIHLTLYPDQWTIELKSLKIYKDGFRNELASYERLANVIFGDLLSVYEPKRLRLVMRLRPRGGISSVITIDSDWAVRGGKEVFNDWKQEAERAAGDPSAHEGVASTGSATV